MSPLFYVKIDPRETYSPFEHRLIHFTRYKVTLPPERHGAFIKTVTSFKANATRKTYHG